MTLDGEGWTSFSKAPDLLITHRTHSNTTHTHTLTDKSQLCKNTLPPPHLSLCYLTSLLRDSGNPFRGENIIIIICLHNSPSLFSPVKKKTYFRLYLIFSFSVKHALLKSPLAFLYIFILKWSSVSVIPFSCS